MASVKLEDLDVYNKGMEIGEAVWTIVEKWNYFQKDTIGKQWVKSADSIAANIAEGYGRYFFKENKLFCYYSRGSLMETKTWLVKAHNRKLVTDSQFDFLMTELESNHRLLNRYINSIGSTKSDKS